MINWFTPQQQQYAAAAVNLSDGKANAALAILLLADCEASLRCQRASYFKTA